MAILAKAFLYLQASRYQITLAHTWFSQLNHLRINVVSVCSLAGKVSKTTWPSDIQECKDKWSNLLQRYS